MDDILKAYSTGAALGGSFRKLDEYEHEKAVRGKMDEFLAMAKERGGDITGIDASAYSDRVGLEAMGRIAGQMSQAEEYRTRMMQNSALQARQRYGMFQQYFSDIEGAIRDGDQQRTVALMSSMANTGGTPYRFAPDEEGGIRVSFVTPEGMQDKGSMSMREAYGLLKPYAENQDRFIRDSVMYGMATQEENAAMMQNTSRWRTAFDRGGMEYTLVPQRIARNGQVVPGFLVAGPGGQRNMTLEEVRQAGLSFGSGAGRHGLAGLGAEGRPGVTEAEFKASHKSMKDLYTAEEVNDETGKSVNRHDPYRSMVAANMLRLAGGNEDEARILFGEMEYAFQKFVSEGRNAELYAKMTPAERSRFFAVFVDNALKERGQAGNAQAQGAPAEQAGSSAQAAGEPKGIDRQGAAEKRPERRRFLDHLQNALAGRKYDDSGNKVQESGESGQGLYRFGSRIWR